MLCHVSKKEMVGPSPENCSAKFLVSRRCHDVLSALKWRIFNAPKKQQSKGKKAY
jgi:hypothetical protein